MSKQDLKQITLSILFISILFIMFGLLKNLFSQPDNSAVLEALRGKPFLVDVRTPGEFASGSVQGAVNIPLDEVASRLKEFKGKESIIVFCRSGNRSAQAKAILDRNGIPNVLNGGTWDQVAALKESL
ncbi:rhodanese-like domain-containing protein [Porphyromonas sp. COT-239 OH1446]|uniref:rhodanese-like domain-containing protein n=1 Tax=Porphyromonas sp. COT-239 OH1446 TaxID=1515613 RepID=UPI00052C4C0B|nr:rhodanese-like domain-containing protein [Porphyromonas sp. COT-239 OH1446]KGN69964.1 sulfurtransferase [Porphyromonas sp. COT-239 OH1446]